MAFQILFWTGMRIGELLALQVKDVNFEDGTIRVDESLTMKERLIEKQKVVKEQTQQKSMHTQEHGTSRKHNISTELQFVEREVVYEYYIRKKWRLFDTKLNF